MSHISLYSHDFPQPYQVKETDVIALFQQEDWKTMNDVVVCRNKQGNAIARFGENRWNLNSISRNREKSHVDFTFLNDVPILQLELKLLAYGWLFHKAPRQPKAPKFSTLVERISNIKTPYQYLKNTGSSSFSALSDKKIWADFEIALIKQNYTQGSLAHIFASMNHAIALEPWLQFSLGFTQKIESKKLAKILSEKEKQQTLVIPEKLSDAIYGKAIELIKGALPYQDKISQIEEQLQDNYLEGKRILDDNIQAGIRYTHTNANGNFINNQKYAQAIHTSQPLKTTGIIYPLSGKIQGIVLNNAADLRQYLGQLITACYIVCGGLSGMRDSELGELTPNSYYKETFNGRDYHMLQSRTFKLGEKRVTWVAAPIVEQAITLASTLTQTWREQIKQSDDEFKNALWCNQTARSKLPVVINNWNQRLKRFCKQFNFIVTENDYQECVESNPRSLDNIKTNVIVGQPWPLSSHQFRRSLAFYCIKHRLGTTVALKQQFKHLYLAMTEWYTNGGRLASLTNLKVDNNIQKTLDDINAESTTSKIFKQWHSEESLSGTFGKAIIKMRNDIPHIYSSWDIIYQAVKKGILTLHGTAHSYCKNGYKCDMDGIAMPQFCVNCDSGSSIINKDQAKWWQRKHQSCIRYMALGEDISQTDRSHYITQIRAAEIVMSDFDMEFTPFEAELKVMEL